MNISASPSWCPVSTNAPRVDARDKVTGKALFGADMAFDGMLFGQVVRSKYAHARLSRIDSSQALAVPGVAAVLTAADVPASKAFGVVVPHQPVFAFDRVRYLGDGIAMVIADSWEAARAAAVLVDVEYAELPALFSTEEALAPEAPEIHSEYPGNICVHHVVRKGDVDQGFAEADVVLERDYATQLIEHAYIEPEAAVAVPGPSGGVLVYGSIQNPFSCRRAVAGILGLPLAKVRIVQLNMGGSFGGKDEVMSAMAARAALGALLTGRPVKLVNTREESLVESYKRHPYRLHYKVGAMRDGRLVAIEARMVADAGAYASQTPFVTWRSTVQATGPYVVPNVRTDVFGVFTNNTYTGAMRGFGSPQAIFAQESLMDELAGELGIDPLDIRMTNGFEQGSVTATGQVLEEHTVSLKEVIRRATEASGYAEKRKRLPLQNQAKAVKRGIGFACSFRGCALGAEGVDAAGAIVSVQTDGSVLVFSGLAENGQGLKTIFSQIAATELGVTLDRVIFMETDTSTVPDSGPTVASRSTIMGGNAVRIAARKAGDVLMEQAAKKLGRSRSELVAEANSIFAAAEREMAGSPRMGFDDAVKLAWNAGELMAQFGWFGAPHVDWHEDTGQGRAYFTYVYACQVAEVAVDTDTGQVIVEHITAAHDVGRAINPQSVEGQIFGGVAMGTGYGLLEEVELENGRTKTQNFDEYLIPTAVDVPCVTPIIVENPDSYGPYGAKTIGEPTCELGAAAIANAIANACGRRVRELPMDMERVLLGRALRPTRGRRGSERK
ncbi:MAG: xanthine dehydrogenase family protein molybdopterin-binding subunit [Clostridia bacterium]|nr:xanthine dehydrogenase family protein molybdopterin-binding subunit [Clostridia bacterium]